MEIDNLQDTQRGTQGFGSSNIGPKRLIMCKDLQVEMCSLNPDPQKNSYFDEEDIHRHTRLRDEITMLSSAMITAIQMQTMQDSFLDRKRVAGKADDNWTARKRGAKTFNRKRGSTTKSLGIGRWTTLLKKSTLDSFKGRTLNRERKRVSLL